MAFTHITPADLSGKGVVGLPDTPQLSALAMQQKFDEIATDVIVPKFNDLADELDNGAGAIMNVTDPTSGTTDTLQNTLDHIETENALNTADRHNHANKATLDDIDATVKAAYDRLVTLLGAITGIQSVLSSSTAELPDAKAVADAIATVQAEVSLNTAARHAHVNKATLDDITALVKQGYDDLVTLLTGITGIETTLTNANNKIPRSDAVYTAVDNLAGIVALNTAARHTHANKATLDAIDALTKQAYDALVTTFSGKTIGQTVTNDANELPSGAAIVAYVQSLGGGDMTKAVYDTNDDGTVDSADYATMAGYANSAGDSTKLGGLNSSAYAATTDLQKLFGDVATYQATSVALRNYAVGDFMIYENNFYKVTTAISSGGTIVKGAGGNITQTTVGAVLTALNGDMTGATSLVAGAHGLVPAPSAGDEDKFLKGDGSWDDVPNPSDMTGATSLTPGTHGLVPAPAAGDEDKVLKGDGTWGTADEATVRYDENSSYVQCKDSNGWFNWKYASRVPDGRTVTPINDVEILQECAGLPSTYNTISALLADTVTMAAIIADSNAVDYLVRSTSFASDVCADQSAMTAIGNNNYAANTLIANVTWLTAVLNSTYIDSVLNLKNPAMTSDTTPTGYAVSASSTYSGYHAYSAFDYDYSSVWNSQRTGEQEYLQFEFPNQVKIIAVAITLYTNSSLPTEFLDITLSHGNDAYDLVTDSNFILENNENTQKKILQNPQSHSIYKLASTAISGRYGLVREITLYGREDV